MTHKNTGMRSGNNERYIKIPQCAQVIIVDIYERDLLSYPNSSPPLVFCT